MNIILNAPFKLPREEIQTTLAIKPGSSSEIEFKKILGQVEEIARPKSIYRVAYVENRSQDSVTIENETFHSQVMRLNFDEINRVFPYIATCGPEVDEFPLDEGDILKQYWINAIKLSLLHTAFDHLVDTIKKRFMFDDISNMNPGSGEMDVWPIEEQSELFSLLGGQSVIKKEIGVRLLPSYLMIPDMTTSGILFPSQVSYVNCQLCKREDCPSRQAEFDETLWQSIQK